MTAEDSVLTDTTGSVEALTAAVAGHVRSHRAARGWSLDELAGRSGVSKGMVVAIEAARTNPSVGTLCRLADAFGVNIADLLEVSEPRRVAISSADAAPVLWRGDNGGSAQLLRGMNEPDLIELWRWELGPGDRHGSPNHSPGTREMLHVLSGTLTAVIDGAPYTVEPGETIDFIADAPHEYRNDGAEPTRVMMVVVTPAGEWDRRH
jgi:transcriptional regulator with XRE-family HTH domain